MAHPVYRPPVGGSKQSHPEITDHCRPNGETSFPEHSYPATGTACCTRCASTEK